MDALRSAVPLSRLFLALADGRRRLEVRVRARSRTALVRIDSGAVVSVDGVDGEPLGDALMRLGLLDVQRHQAALRDATAQTAGRVGEWLVSVGAASRASVGVALEMQLRGRMAALLRWPEPIFELVPANEHASLHEPMAHVELTSAVWCGLSAIARDLAPQQLAALAGEGALKLTNSGKRIVSALAPEEAARAPLWLGRSPQAEGRVPRAVLRTLGAAVDASFDGDACNLLLRKQREIKRRVGPRALLDLPSHARSEQARPALRRLAQKLHPDRFHALEPGLRSASDEVMRALSQAERELLASPARRR